MLVPHNVRMKPSKVEKKKNPLNVTKVLSNVMLVLPNMTIEPLNVRKKKKKKTTKCDKRIVTCNIGTAQYKNWTIRCEKKIKEPPNVIKVQSHVIYIGTAQYENKTVKCEEKKENYQM